MVLKTDGHALRIVKQKENKIKDYQQTCRHQINRGISTLNSFSILHLLWKKDRERIYTHTKFGKLGFILCTIFDCVGRGVSPSRQPKINEKRKKQLTVSLHIRRGKMVRVKV
jgi:hypothetical protein